MTLMQQIARLICCPSGCYCENVSPPAEACYAAAIHWDTAEKIMEVLRKPSNGMMNAGTRCLALEWEITCDGRIAPEIWERMIEQLLQEGKAEP